jgi:reductive dehalogenase
MRLFSTRERPVHQGPYPTEKLGRRQGIPELGLLAETQPLVMANPDDEHSIGHAFDDYISALDAVRDGPAKAEPAPIPADPGERAEHLKSAGYFLDASMVGVCALDSLHHLEEGFRHPNIEHFLTHSDTNKVRLRFNPGAVIALMEASAKVSSRSIHHHSHAIVFLQEYPRDPAANEPGAAWVVGMQAQRAAFRVAETATCLAHYLRLLGFEARSHSATSSDVNLDRLTVSAGLAGIGADATISNPFVGPRFGLAVVTTTMELALDEPLRSQTLADKLRSKGPSWWLGAAASKNAWNQLEFAKRKYVNSRFPTENLKRKQQTTSFIDGDRIPRSPKSSEFFLRAAFGDLGEGPQQASVDGHSVSKAPLAAALRLGLNTYSLLQRGSARKTPVEGYNDPRENADLVKATLHYLGADLAGISEAPAWVWYSHRQDGSEIEVEHKYAISVVIDQGHESMEGSSGDDWISSAQSMRTYMRASLLCGVVAQHLRNLGYSSTTHSAADGDVLQPPLLLLSGLGEVSRIGETILNPFLGPRNKSGVLTTNFPMEVDLPIDFGLQNFCENCNKCARECPSGAISAGPKVMFNGYEIWKADVEKCTRYRMTNDAGSMCGRCMKICPWNLEGLFKEAPFRWAAMNLPWAARWLARLDDWVGKGRINPVKKWWWDLSTDQGSGAIVIASDVNRRDIHPELNLQHSDQTLACYPADLIPSPYPAPNPLDREAGIQAYEELRSPADYQARLQAGETEGLVPELVKANEPSPTVLVKLDRRYTSSADGKIDIFEFVSLDGAPLPEFAAGAHTDIFITPQFIRQFSLAGNPGDTSRYVLGILREDEGRGGSQRIHAMLKEGNQVLISKPRNHFPLIANARFSLLLAGGIGVTPLIAMAHELHALGEEFRFYYKCSRRVSAAFIEELQSVPWADKVAFHFSDENRLKVADVLGDFQTGDHLYTCGPSEFMDAVFESANELGWDEESLHREYFMAPAVGGYENHPFQIELASSGRVIEVPADRTAVDALTEAGVPVDVKCSDGICGVCSTPYVSGDIEHRDYVLSKAEREHRMVLCCSRASEAGGKLILDL